MARRTPTASSPPPGSRHPPCAAPSSAWGRCSACRRSTKIPTKCAARWRSTFHEEQHALQLGDLLAGSGLAYPPAAGRLEIADLQEDSRKVKAGTLFAALPGSKLDGRRFIAQAVAAGAVAVLAPVGTKAEVPVIESFEPRETLAKLAARF